MRLQDRRRHALHTVLAVAVPVAMITGTPVPVAAATHASTPAAPAVKAVSPTYGTPAGRTRVTITGTGFTKVKSVSFGRAAGRSIKVLSARKMQVTAPAHKAGVVDIRVSTAHGRSAVVTHDRFRYAGAPTVTKLSARTGSTVGGDTIVVRGKNFYGVRSVTFGKTASKRVIVKTGTTLTAEVPPGKAGPTNVRVTNVTGRSPATAGSAYTYLVPAKWRAAELALPETGNISDISCPTPAFCAAVDYSGNALTATDGKWTAPVRIDTVPAGNTEPNSLDAVACTSASFCVAAGRSGQVFNWTGSQWVATSDSDGRFRSIGCASVSLCFAVVTDFDGDSPQVWRYDGSAWAEDFTYPGDEPREIACGAPGSCAVLSSEGVTVWDGSWQDPTAPDGFDGFLVNIACPSATFCLVTDFDGRSRTLADGTWGAPVTIPGLEDGYTSDVACSDATHCVAADGSTVLRYDGATWHALTAGAAPQLDHPFGVACTGSACVATDGAAIAPVADSALGSATTIDPPEGGVHDLDCASSTFCVATGDGGQAAVFDGSTWQPGPTALDDSLAAVSCPSRSFCLAVGEDGSAESFDGQAWTVVDTPPAVSGFSSVSCVSARFCVAVEPDATAWIYDGARWTSHAAHADGGTTVSCASAAFCVIADANGRTTTYASGRWSTPKKIAHGAIYSVACPTAAFCLAAASDSVVYRFDGTKWTKAKTLLPYGNLYGFDVTCVSSTYCKVSTGGYNGVNDFVRSGVWTLAGTKWTSPQQLRILPAQISCASARFCAAGEDHGYLQIYR